MLTGACVVFPMARRERHVAIAIAWARSVPQRQPGIASPGFDRSAISRASARVSRRLARLPEAQRSLRGRLRERKKGAPCRVEIFLRDGMMREAVLQNDAERRPFEAGSLAGDDKPVSPEVAHQAFDDVDRRRREQRKRADHLVVAAMSRKLGDSRLVELAGPV